MSGTVDDDSWSDAKAARETAAATALTALGSTAAKANAGGPDQQKDFEIPQRYTKSGRKRAVPFPLKLMKVLSNNDFSHIITWTPSGKSFSIVKPKAFVAEILPDNFKSAKYASFTRKLHRWGFMRHYRGDEAGAFFHKDFQKDRLDLVEKMTCHKPGPTKAPMVKNVKAPAPEPASKLSVPAQPVPDLVQGQTHKHAQQAPSQQPSEIMARLHKQQQLQASELDATEALNAAIEAEVTRRLKERIQAAALSRLAVMQQLNPPNPPRQPWGLPAGSLQAQLLQLQQKRQLGFEASCLALSSAPPVQNQGLEEVPRRNVQGAKTA